MTAYKFAAEYNPDHDARAVGRDLSVSMKHAVNVCAMVRGRSVVRAKQMLEEVTTLDRAVPYKQYNRDLSHRKGDMLAGRYPTKVSKEVLTVVKSAEANAVDKGLNAANLIIKSISVHKASGQYHYGRHRGRNMKRAHVEIVVCEGEVKKKEAKKPSKQAAPKKEAAPAKKAEPAKEAPAKKEEAKPAEKSQPQNQEKKEAPKEEAPKAEAQQ